MYEISTTINWVDLMYLCTMATGFDSMPSEFSNFSISIYFVAFIVVGNFFLLNLFVGVVISTYNREKEL